MALRASSLQSTNTLAINREIGSQYDVILEVKEHLDKIALVAAIDVDALLTELQDAQDFSGISVVAGEVAGWDPVTKVITVPTIKGDKGDTGSKGDTGATGPVGSIGPRGLTGPAGRDGVDGADGVNGIDGINGVDGVDGKDLTIEQITYDGNSGKFTWHFSDGTTYVTPDLRGEKGNTGSKGDKGDTGISVHHLKGTSTTNPNGDFGTSPFRDTYTLYGDPSETIVLGYFTVANGVSDGMSAAVYDANGNGVVDDSERLGGELPNHYVNVSSAQSIRGDKTFVDNVVVQGNFTVNGTSTTVDTENVLVKDNTIIVNSGEVGAGVTVGEAGIIVDRGTAADYKFVFDEASDSFKIGESGSLQKVATREDTPLDTGLAVWDDSTSKFSTTLDVKVDSLQFNGGIGTQGTVNWNADEETLDIVQNGAILQVGQEVQIHCRNSTASVIGDGVVVMATGTLGASGRITVAPYDGVTDVKYIIGVTTEPIPIGEDGKVTHFGKIRGLDTSGWVEGAVLYATANGGLTSVVPTSGIKMPIAFVVSSHANTGTLMVRVTPVNELAYEPKNTNIQSHISSNSNPHGVTKAQVGLGSVDNTADNAKNVLSATKWTTARTITLSGDVAGSVSMDGTANVSITTTVQPNSVALGTDTTGNYVAGITQGTGITISGTAGEGWSPTVALGTVGTAGTYRSVTTDVYGRVTAGTNPTTVAGYGLTDVYTKTEIDTNIGTVAEFNAAINF